MNKINIKNNETLIFDESDIIEIYQGLSIMELDITHFKYSEGLSIMELDITHFKYSEGLRMTHTATNIMFISNDGEIKILKARRPAYYEESVVVLGSN